jgi:ABC-2 type transport system ATP-binding protein
MTNQSPQRTIPVINIQDLSYTYGKLQAVQNLNLSVNPGEIYGFLGPNGAGKTTTIRAMLDFLRPQQGKIEIFGMDSTHQGPAIRQRIGYLSSELVLWENWTGRQYIRWLERVRQQKFMAEAERLAEQLEYELDRPLRGMSTGMKRKMGLIATLAHKPDLLILDEPTIGLDPLMQKSFEELMRQVRTEGRTVFLSSHILPEVEAICDRVAIIREGKLQAVHRVADLTRLSFRWLTLKLSPPLTDANGFTQLEGVSDLKLNNGILKMRVSGHANLDKLIKHIAQHHVEAMEFEHPTLEETFLTYYGKHNHKSEVES